MALYKIKCESCGNLIRKLLNQRPELENCTLCQGTTVFVTDTQSMVMESLDNGIMVRKVERLKDAPELVKERGTEKPEDHII